MDSTHRQIMERIVDEVKKIHGEERWPSNVEQKLEEISELLRVVLDKER